MLHLMSFIVACTLKTIKLRSNQCAGILTVIVKCFVFVVGGPLAVTDANLVLGRILPE